MTANQPTLVILAAGIGSRYGGLKQLDTFTPQGDTIMDFSIFDAIQAGFGKIVFIIRKGIEKEFRAIYESKLSSKVEVEFVFQEVEDVPPKYLNPNRKKPWGTAHAVLAAKNAVKENFTVINADDFYGREAFVVMAKYLSEIDTDSYDFCMMAYQLENTISDFGSVSRGECTVGSDGYLEAIVERTKIEKKGDLLVRKNNKEQETEMVGNTIVSMNFWGFTPKYFEFGDMLFDQFLSENFERLKAEFFISMVINEIIKSEHASIKVLHSGAKWFGVTYQQDKELVEAKIEKLRDNNIYPTNLWA